MYSKEQLRKSLEFLDDVVILNIVVNGGEIISKEEARERIERFKSKEVIA